MNRFKHLIIPLMVFVSLITGAFTSDGVWLEIKNQSFNVKLNNFGNVRFTTEQNKSIKKFRFCIKDSKGNEDYILQLKSTDMDDKVIDIISVDAISFKDINNDKLKDILVIVSYNAPQSDPDVDPSMQKGIVYTATTRGFIQDKDLNKYIGDGGSVLEVKDVKEYVVRYENMMKFAGKITSAQAEKIVEKWEKDTKGVRCKASSEGYNFTVVNSTLYYFCYAEGHSKARGVFDSVYVNSKTGNIYIDDTSTGKWALKQVN
jgi:hypothetical protein